MKIKENNRVSFFKYIVITFFISSVIMICLMFFWIFSSNPNEMKKENILKILSQETVILFNDAKTQVGSLYGADHRQYVKIQDIPKNMIHAAISAEDQNFFNHIGVDLKGVIRAFYNNLFLNRREGASTITTLTVKNLYGRGENKYISKFLEIIRSIKFDHMYSKEEILEFYLNQFHVTGNGRGIGIAARYYFNKEPNELNLVECAFIAASFKGPVKYDPSIKPNKEMQIQAKKYAFERKNYVLRRMFEDNYIDEKTYKKASKEQVPFKHGKFDFQDQAVSTLIKRQLEKNEIFTALKNTLNIEDISEIGTMGLRIITTLNYNIQKEAIYAHRKNLSLLEYKMTGFKKEEAKNYLHLSRIEKHEFYTAKIEKINNNNILVKIGPNECYIETTSFFGDKTNIKKIKSTLVKNDYVFVSVKNNNDGWLCDLETRPIVQGASLILDKSEIIALIGGFYSHEYNRAVFAKRQPGSTFKPLLFYAAEQLGWSYSDSLLNVLNIYPWRSQIYFPSSAHIPTQNEVNFIDAIATSENYASVWMLYHLTDKLSESQFNELLSSINLIKENENDNNISNKLIKEWRFNNSDSNYYTRIFKKAIDNYLIDINNDNNKIIIRAMNYGENNNKIIQKTNNETLAKTHVLKNNFLYWKMLAQNCKEYLNVLSEENNLYNLKIKIIKNSEKIACINFNPYLAEIAKQGNIIEYSTENAFSKIIDNNELLKNDNIYLDGVIKLSFIEQLNKEIEDKFEEIKNFSLKDKLYWHNDFKVFAGMQYFIAMLNKMGIDSKLNPVLSMPLGANDVTLLELALAYQTMTDGKIHKFFNDGPENQSLIIKRIEDNLGQLIWEAEHKTHELINENYSPPLFSAMRATITRGTGNKAHNSIILRSNDEKTDKILSNKKIFIPTFGKTGTTNRSINALFMGFLPKYEDSVTSDLSSLYTIATYVGYDNNKPMKKLTGGGISGADGSLPGWINIALTVIKEKEYIKKFGKITSLKANSFLNFTYDQVNEKTYNQGQVDFFKSEIQNVIDNKIDDSQINDEEVIIEEELNKEDENIKVEPLNENIEKNNNEKINSDLNNKNIVEEIPPPPPVNNN